MKHVILPLLLVCSSAWALGARDLVPDAERLYSQLGSQEPERKAVALRLADLMFDAAVEIDGDASSTRKQMDLAETYRHRAQHIYEETLPGLKGLNSLRVKFQLSRLHVFAARPDLAMKYWLELIHQTEDPRLRRESALHMAEQLELSNKAESILEAGRLYVMVLPLAEKPGLKSYIQYRLAWTQFRSGQVETAVETLQKSISLSASDKERDDLFKDLILFLSRQARPATQQMALLASYEKRYQKTGLVAQLGEAYATADRKEDYVLIMTALNNRRPSLERTVSLLDASNDTLSQAAIGEYLMKLQKLRLSGQKFPDEASEKLSKDRLYRLVLLWDGQRRAKPEEFDALFAKGVDSMVVVFPSSEEAKKSIGGWLAAHADKQQQLTQLDHWLDLTEPLNDAKLETGFRQSKLEAARQLKQWAVVVEESKRLEKLVASQTRESRYQRAKALYELKRYDEALPIFISLATPAKPDEISKFSQDLALDIFAIEKRFDDIIRSARAWRGTGPRAQEMVALEEKARFQRAATLQDAQGLSEFTQFCLNKKFLPKSCDNARSLAARLRDQEKLVTVLRAQGDEAELARQLEVGGRFGESARLQEKTAKGDLALLKVALLYELQGEMAERDRVLKGFLKQWSHREEPVSADEQSLIYQTLQDAGLINESSLQLPLAPEYKARAAGQLYQQSGSKLARKVLIEHCGGPGESGWQKVHLQAMQEIYTQQRGIQFVGARSEAHFEQRVAALKKLAAAADCFNKGAPAELRLATARKMAQAFLEFSQQIRGTAIPDGLDEETLKQVHAQIDSMAQPFEQTAAQWQALAESEEREVVEANIPVNWNFSPLPSPARTAVDTKLAFSWKPMLEEIRKNPFERQPQENLKAYFDQKGSARLSAYMNGRLQSLSTESVQ